MKGQIEDPFAVEPCFLFYLFTVEGRAPQLVSCGDGLPW
jgi:hypothetical protein